MKTISFLFVSLALVRNSVFAINYYVSNAGKNANPGSLSKPFLTIQHALNKASNAGDTIFVRAGNYFEQLNFPFSGSSEKSIVLTNYANESVIIDGSKIPLTENNFVKILGQSNIIIKGLKFRNFINRALSSAGIAIIGGSTNVKVLNNEFQDFSPQDTLWGEVRGISVFSFNKQAVTNYIISGNKFLRISCGQSEVIDNVGYVSNFEISNNEVIDASVNPILQCGGGYDIPFNGYQTDSMGVPDNGIFRNNYIHDNIRGHGTCAIYVDGGRDMIIENNLLVNNICGIAVGCEEKRAVKSSNVIIRNNVLIGNFFSLGIGNSVDYFANRPPGAVDSVFIYNNTIVKAYDGLAVDKKFPDSNMGYQGLGIDKSKASNIFVYNNIFWHHWGKYSDPVIRSDNPNVPNFKLDNNLYYTGEDPQTCKILYGGNLYISFPTFQAATHNEANGKFGDPLFVNFPTNLNLRAGSPAIDAGTELIYANTDFHGNIRPYGAAPDMGAFEFGSSIPTDVTPPSTPWNLTSSAVTSSDFVLNWTASYDNSGVVSYDVFKNGVSIGTTSSPSFYISGLKADTAYVITIKAKDTAGNLSPACTDFLIKTAGTTQK